MIDVRINQYVFVQRTRPNRRQTLENAKKCSQLLTRKNNALQCDSAHNLAYTEQPIASLQPLCSLTRHLHCKEISSVHFAERNDARGFLEKRRYSTLSKATNTSVYYTNNLRLQHSDILEIKTVKMILQHAILEIRSFNIAYQRQRRRIIPICKISIALRRV